MPGSSIRERSSSAGRIAVIHEDQQLRNGMRACMRSKLCANMLQTALDAVFNGISSGHDCYLLTVRQDGDSGIIWLHYMYLQVIR